MIEIEEGDLKFSFPNHCEVAKYDDWEFYRKHFQGGSRNWFRWLMGLWSRGQQTNVNGELRIG